MEQATTFCKHMECSGEMKKLNEKMQELISVCENGNNQL
jgi:hypothetical protein